MCFSPAATRFGIRKFSRMGALTPVFFGAFSQRRKIAYAPSFGIPHIPENMEEELRNYLKDFSHLSVRERQGRQIVERVTGEQVPVVLDPTLLLRREDWTAVATRPRGIRRLSRKAPAGDIFSATASAAPGALAPYVPPPGGGDGPAGGAALRRSAEGFTPRPTADLGCRARRSF